MRQSSLVRLSSEKIQEKKFSLNCRELLDFVNYFFTCSALSSPVFMTGEHLKF